jgi:two-component system chemotaxis response regulator CheY
LQIFVKCRTLLLMAINTEKQILLIEDDRAITELYKYKLELHGLTVLCAQNGLEGLKLAKVHSVDLILLDLRMPVMDGEEFLRRFRKNTANDEAPVLVLTNISRDEAPKTLWHYGISGYFVKAHSTPADLLREVVKILQNPDSDSQS